MGGYQVLKALSHRCCKWLSYREYELLHPSLGPEEVREVRAIVHRIAAILYVAAATQCQLSRHQSSGLCVPCSKKITDPERR